MKCDKDKCNRPATVHLIEIKNGKKIEQHLCESHAEEQGITHKETHLPINELLEKFMIKQGKAEQPAATPVCDHCGMSFEDFRREGLLGCPECYSVFEPALSPLLQRAHEGATHHVGKRPADQLLDETRQQRLLMLRRMLDEAVASEQYERAAKLRDEVKGMEAETA